MTSHMARPRFSFVFVLIFIASIFWLKRNQLPILPRPHHSPPQSSTVPNVAETTPQAPVSKHTPINEDHSQRPLSNGFSDLPSIYKQEEEQPKFCADRFGLPFLTHLNKSASSYCSAGSTASATCFKVVTTNDRSDNLCIAGPVTYDAEKRIFSLPCDVESGKSFSSLGRYWYDTGPSVVFDQFVDVQRNVQKNESEVSDAKSISRSELLLLIKREAPGNLWHSLMEVLAAMLSLDTVSMARDPRTHASLLAEEDDLSKMRVVILDPHEEGPFWDVYQRFSPLPMVKIADLRPEMADGNRIVVPLVGGANPFWQGDWDVFSCRQSALLDVFVQRILKLYDFPAKPRAANAGPIRLTYIDRRGKRKLFDQDAHIEALRTKFPDVKIEVVDFAQMSFQAQVEKARETDILVGVHGAGLTHAMFMERESAVVEIMPETLNHKGFRNMAKLRGLEYYGAHGTEVSAGEDWHWADVNLDLDSYVHLIDAAIAGVSNSGNRNYDIH